jgi:hypothetical protein
MRLADEQISLIWLDGTTFNDDKLQFYLEQKYKANAFDKIEMMNWENQPMATKTDSSLAKEFFEKLIKSYETYEKIAGAASKNAHDSASRLVDVGNELRKYINQIAAANAEQKEVTAANIGNNKDSGLAADVKQLTEALAQWTKMVTDKENKPPSNINTGGRRSNKQYTGVRSMGAYCSSHGYHPAKMGHTSTMRKYKKEGHNNAAVWGNILGGNDHWPATTCIAIVQQDHATYKNKSKPTAWQGPGTKESRNNNNNAALNKITQSQFTNYYSILSLLPCQVKEQADPIIL